MGEQVFSMGVAFVALFAILIVVSRRFRRIVPRRPDYSGTPRPNTGLLRLEQSGRYRGVRIEANCRAAEALAGRDFEFATAPHLPVTGCDAAVCSCRYVGLPERRVLAERRAGADRRRQVRAGSGDRRRATDRRSDTAIAWSGSLGRA